MKAPKKFGMAAAAMLVSLTACDKSSQTERALTQMEQAEPAFAMLREHEPAAYREMRALVDETISKDGQPDQRQLIQRSREIFARTIERRVMTAPDELVRELMVFVADQTAHLESNPTVCADLLRGSGGDVRALIPPEMQQRERRLYENLLKAPSAERAISNEAQAMPIVAGILSDAQRALGLSESAVTTALEGLGPPLRVCRANGYLMLRLSLLPPGEGAPIFRLLSRLAAAARPPSPVA